MDVKSIANSSNIARSYSIDVNQYVAPVTLSDSKVQESNESQKDNNENSNESKEKKYEKKDLDKAVNKLNKFLEDDNTRAEYSVHKDLGTLMIKIVDKDTDKIILEVPPEKILNMVASMCKQVGLFDKKA